MNYQVIGHNIVWHLWIKTTSNLKLINNYLCTVYFFLFSHLRAELPSPGLKIYQTNQIDNFHCRNTRKKADIQYVCTRVTDQNENLINKGKHEIICRSTRAVKNEPSLSLRWPTVLNNALREEVYCTMLLEILCFFSYNFYRVNQSQNIDLPVLDDNVNHVASEK